MVPHSTITNKKSRFIFFFLGLGYIGGTKLCNNPEKAKGSVKNNRISKAKID
jgi:hypothetical protein